MDNFKKMDAKDWGFILVWVLGVFALAFVLDILLDLVDGGFLAIIGTIFGGVILGKRLKNKK